MTDAASSAVKAALDEIPDPEGSGSLVKAGRVRQVRVTGGAARIWLDLPPGTGSEAAKALHYKVETAVTALDGITKAEVIISAEREANTAPAPHQHQHPRPGPTRGGPIVLPGVKDIIAVASGKGGVGKSTVAVNLALALAAQGKSAGLLDADIYGPSMPRMLGLAKSPNGDGKAKLKPAEAFGLKVMSIGLLVDTEKPMIWRGPMVASALSQMLSDVDWGTLDILVVDMPPGTGDAQLTMAQRVPLSGAVIVSTPQEIALIDARKGLAMFQQVHVPVLGIVENMAWFEAPGSGTRSYIFGQGGARRTAEALGCPFLGEVPIIERIREDCDTGKPTVAADPGSEAARPFHDIARQVLQRLETACRPPPKIVIV